MKYLFLTSTFLISLVSNSQDLLYSHREYSNQQTNPASVGTSEAVKFTTGFRNQWYGIGKGFQSTLVSGEGVLNKQILSSRGKLALGAYFINDKLGSSYLSNTYGAVNLAYHLRISRKETIGVGLYTGLGSLSIDPNIGTWSSQYSNGSFDQSLSSGETFARNSFSYLDAGTGIMYHYKDRAIHKTGTSNQFKVGVGFFHLNRPSYSFLKTDKKEALNIRTSASIESSFLIGKSLSMSPSIFVNFQQTNKEFLFGSNFIYGMGKYAKPINLGIGLHHRLKDALITQVSLQYGYITTGFSYELSISSISDYGSSKGAFELFLRFAKLSSKEINTRR